MIGRLRSRHKCSGDAGHIRFRGRLWPSISRPKVTWIPLGIQTACQFPGIPWPAAYPGGHPIRGDVHADHAPLGRKTESQPFHCINLDTSGKDWGPAGISLAPDGLRTLNDAFAAQAERRPVPEDADGVARSSRSQRKSQTPLPLIDVRSITSSRAAAPANSDEARASF